ncbi:MAG: C-terminal helicase domain-containing protein [Bacteroidia bacterium]|nr:C-terminal helicase domain-containing protein [Bacteroidia bacterium]
MRTQRIDLIQSDSVKGSSDKNNSSAMPNNIQNIPIILLDMAHPFCLKIKFSITTCFKVDGSYSATQKQNAVDSFQNENTKLFVGNIQAADIGLTLTASSNVVFLELDWSPSKHDQASDRVHRIGQKDSVNVYYLLSKDTIEERIAKILDEKRITIDAVLDGKETEQESLLYQLMKSYKSDSYATLSW